MPLHPTRERERGYNQSAILASELQYLLPLQVAPVALQRTRATADQTALSAAQRTANVRGAFGASPDAVGGRRVWLLDDVHTTGATLHAGARALRDAGAREVRGAVIAVASGLGRDHVEYPGRHV
jgi:ComF family protein